MMKTTPKSSSPRKPKRQQIQSLKGKQFILSNRQFDSLTSPSQKSNSLTLVLNCCCWLDSFRCWLFSLDFCTRYSHCCWSLVILSFTISSLPAHLRCSIRPVYDIVQCKACSLAYHYGDHALGVRSHGAHHVTYIFMLNRGRYSSCITRFLNFFMTQGLLFAIYLYYLAFSRF